MKKTITSEWMGIFTFDEGNKSYWLDQGGRRWSIEVLDGQVDVQALLKRAEKLFHCIEQFDQEAKRAIAERLVHYKNDFWPVYDENDEKLDWEAVDAGEYDVTPEAFEEAITLCDIQIAPNHIYCEYKDGDLFGGHRIHASFGKDYKLISADV